MVTVILTTVVVGVWVYLIMTSLLNRVGKLHAWAIFLLGIAIFDSVALVSMGVSFDPFVLVAVYILDIGIGLVIGMRYLYFAIVVYNMARWGDPKFFPVIYLVGYTILAIALSIRQISS